MKEFEVVERQYKWYKYTREYAYPESRNMWTHLKSYKTMEAANDALRDLRRNGFNKQEFAVSQTVIDAFLDGFRYPAYVRFIRMTRYKAQRKTKPRPHNPLINSY